MNKTISIYVNAPATIRSRPIKSPQTSAFQFFSLIDVMYMSNTVYLAQM